jgi:hypothetical protein
MDWSSWEGNYILGKKGTWIEVDVTDAQTKILPGTWVFRRKRTPPEGSTQIWGTLLCPRWPTRRRFQHICTHCCLEYCETLPRRVPNFGLLYMLCCSWLQ